MLKQGVIQLRSHLNINVKKVKAWLIKCWYIVFRNYFPYLSGIHDIYRYHRSVSEKIANTFYRRARRMAYHV